MIFKKGEMVCNDFAFIHHLMERGTSETADYSSDGGKFSQQCFIQMQLIGTFVHYFVLDCIVISIAAIICSPFVSMTHYLYLIHI